MKNLSLHTLIIVILFLTAFGSCEKDTVNLDLEPVLDFEIQLTDSIAPAGVYFLNKSVNLENFEWDFGDGTISHETSPEHIFDKAGEYTITLIAWSDNEQLSIEKTIYLCKIYQYTITNHSQFKLFNLTSFPNKSSEDSVCINQGNLNANESSGKCLTQSEYLYISFENEEGLKFKTAFPFYLKEKIINEFIIDKCTLVVIDN